MKRELEVKYPHSASLFQFCRRVLDHKFGGIRVIDQDVGQILGYDPADCSHWKKGKKNIKSIHAMKSIADHLGIDEKLVVDIASGEIDETEAFFEYHGYGDLILDPSFFEAAKKEFYRKHATSWNKDKEEEVKALFSPDIQLVDRVVNQIHQKINFQEAPLYLPELVSAYPEIRLTGDAAKVESLGPMEGTAAQGDKENLEVFFVPGQEMKPYIRYKIARSIGQHFLEKARPSAKERDYLPMLEKVRDVEANLFAAKLLAPAFLVRKEMERINVAKDIIGQLSEIFWVSRTFMNRRLRYMLQYE